jgi:hypothetical protein
MRLKTINQKPRLSIIFYIGSDIPLKFKNGSILLLSPFYENWISIQRIMKIFSRLLAVLLSHELYFPLLKKWSLNLTAIPRLNGEELDFNNAFQMGGLAFASYKAKEQQKFRFGIYVNNDFFGLFVIPLAGIDWRIDQKNYLFGLLPGRLTFEHQLSHNLYTGLLFVRSLIPIA